MAVLATTAVMKDWADIEGPSEDELSAVLDAIERFANYRPGRGADHYDWWVASIKTRSR